MKSDETIAKKEAEASNRSGTTKAHAPPHSFSLHPLFYCFIHKSERMFICILTLPLLLLCVEQEQTKHSFLDEAFLPPSPPLLLPLLLCFEIHWSVYQYKPAKPPNMNQFF